MAITSATLSELKAPTGSKPYMPTGDYRLTHLDRYAYEEMECLASGEVDGHPYTTVLFVRLPKDRTRFSGIVIAEPLHMLGIGPIWMYTDDYIMRSGHGWVMIGSQKGAVDAHVKTFGPERYAALDIYAESAPPDSPQTATGLPVRDPAAMASYLEQMRRINAASNCILAQAGAAVAGETGLFSGLGVRHVILAGHSQTGGVVIDYILHGHDANRHADGSSVYHGLFPTGSTGLSPAGGASVTLGPCDVPIVHVLSDGDISDPNRPGREGRSYRRSDSDEPDDRYRLYELAGVAHMGTRYAPMNEPGMWQLSDFGGSIAADDRMNGIAHHELFRAMLDLLVQWVDKGIVPPRAERIQVAPDGYFAKDDHGNSKGGVRCVQMDVPTATYYANPMNPDGTPAFGVVGTEVPFSREKLRQLYAGQFDFVNRFNRRLNELIAQRWYLAADADELRSEADKAHVL
jgi:Alpha/beta hydrolase domain